MLYYCPSYCGVAQLAEPLANHKLVGRQWVRIPLPQVTDYSASTTLPMLTKFRFPLFVASRKGGRPSAVVEATLRGFRFLAEFMAQRRGYIKIWRSYLDSDVYDESYLVRALFMELLLTVNYVDGKMKAGSIETTYAKLADRLGVREGSVVSYPDRFQIYRALKRLEILKIITTTKTKKGHTINIKNWNHFQGSPEKIDESEAPKAARRAARRAAPTPAAGSKGRAPVTGIEKSRAHVGPHVGPHVSLFSKNKNKKRDPSFDGKDQKPGASPSEIRDIIQREFPEARVGEKHGKN